MKLNRLVSLLIVSSVCGAVSIAPAKAELWQGANTQRPKQFSLGAAGQFYFNPTSEFQGFGTAIYGFNPKVQGELRMGLGTLPFYFGAFAKYHFFSSDFIQMAIWGGMHSQSTAFLDAAYIVSHSFKSVEIYFAPVFVFGFSGGNLGIGLVPGFDIYVGRSMKLYVEGIINATKYYDAMSVGIRAFM